MKKYVLLILLLVVSISVFIVQQVDAGYVRGYFRKDGTYVNGYYRTNPDSSPYNNYSYPGNYNPNTGKTSTGNPSTYLNNYYNNSSSGYSYTPVTIPTCPLNSYYSYSDKSCTCFTGYAAKNGQCKSLESVCTDSFGFGARYNSLKSQCECKSGYLPYNGKCTDVTSACQSEFGYGATSTYDDKCKCRSGYKWNSSGSKCVFSY